MSSNLVHEMWRDKEGMTVVCLAGPAGDDARSLFEQDAELAWVFEASSHYQAMTMYYQRMDWGEYTSDHEQDYNPYPEQWVEAQQRTASTWQDFHEKQLVSQDSLGAKCQPERSLDMELSDITNDFGRLIKVESLSFADWPEAISALRLTFEYGEVYHECQADSDELGCSRGLLKDYSLIKDVSADLPWSRAINCQVRWLWRLTNQQGYDDGLQYAFADPTDEHEIIIQLVAIASRIEVLEVYQVRKVERG